uniref:Uncharacterized protein n=1 Tax=Oryza nivara TaxID=4536 RepID=A0A0E0HQC3_ORYNI
MVEDDAAAADKAERRGGVDGRLSPYAAVDRRKKRSAADPSNILSLSLSPDWIESLAAGEAPGHGRSVRRAWAAGEELGDGDGEELASLSGRQPETKETETNFGTGLDGMLALLPVGDKFWDWVGRDAYQAIEGKGEGMAAAPMEQ